MQGANLIFFHHSQLNASAYDFNLQIARLTGKLSLLTFTEIMSYGLALRSFLKTKTVKMMLMLVLLKLHILIIDIKNTINIWGTSESFFRLNLQSHDLQI